MAPALASLIRGPLIRGTALVNNIRTRDRTTLRIACDLVFAGVLGQDMLDRIEDSLDWRNHLMLRQPLSTPAVEQASKIEKNLL